ncbi:MAG: RloB domain-containing protein [Magnetococcales bacterium]|nr:RloB domain-containing protein [Magnetococcales bacterium]
MTAPALIRRHPPLTQVRDRTGLSLERNNPKRPPRDRMLLLASEPALSYLQDFLAHLKITERVVSAAIPHEKDGILAIYQERSKNAGPFRRVYCVLEWDGQQETLMRQTWYALQEAMTIETTGLRLICCRPSFDLWILLHFEEAGAEADDVTWLKNRVEHHLASPATLFDQTKAYLEVAIQRSMKMARERQLKDIDDALLPGSPGVYLHELMTFLRKQASKINNR